MIGEKEKDGKVAIRHLGSNDQKIKKLNEFLEEN